MMIMPKATPTTTGPKYFPSMLNEDDDEDDEEDADTGKADDSRIQNSKCMCTEHNG